MTELLNLHFKRHEAAAYIMGMHRYIYLCGCLNGMCQFCWQGLVTGVWVMVDGVIKPVVLDEVKRQYEDILSWIGTK